MSARARGASDAAALLSEEAWRLTPRDAEAWPRRLLSAAAALLHMGRDERVNEILRPELPHLAAGPARGWAYHYLSLLPNRPARAELARRALADAGDDTRLRVSVLAEAAHNYVAGEVSRVEHACDLAREAYELSTASGDEGLIAYAAVDLAMCMTALGCDPTALLDPVRHVGGELWNHPDRVRALRLLWRGELEKARLLLEPLLERAYAREEEWAALVLTLHLFELASRGGDTRVSGRYLAELETTAAGLDGGAPSVRRSRALRAAALGQREVADAEARAVLEADNASNWQKLEARRARGTAALLAGAYPEAVADLRTVVDAAAAGGIRDPGAFPAAPDLIEALIGDGQFGAARHELERLERQAEEQSHVWARVAAGRARGQLLTAEGDPDGAVRVLHETLAEHEQLSLPRDEARTLLALGRAHRTARRRSEARRTIERAVDAFDALGADGFGTQARAELARLGGRRTAEGLTPMEDRVAALAAEGMTNRQIAAELALTVRTVEAHLTRAYAKLGVRSRTELARRYARGG